MHHPISDGSSRRARTYTEHQIRYNRVRFFSEEGCTVYEDRPAACRYYALGSMGVRKKDASQVEDIYFLVKEDHCRGHEEPRTISVEDYREEQGVDVYDEKNREWRDVVLKKRSSGPTVGRPSDRSKQLFDMCSYDPDSFREFIQTEGFLEISISLLIRCRPRKGMKMKC